jgi:hypothetical protein
MTPDRRRGAAWGVLLVGLYLAAGALTVRATGHGIRPLFDGFGPPPRYQWVAPPKAFAAGNKVPRPSRDDIALDAGGSRAGGVTSADGQLVLNLPAGAVPPGVAGATASVAITPVDPATLAPLPDGRTPDGNAYRVDLAAGQPPLPVASLAKPGSAQLTVPLPAATVFSSPDGQAWQAVESFPVDNIRVSVRLPGGGYYLASAAPVAVTTDTGSSSDASRTLAVAGATVVLALTLVLSPGLVRRVRRRGSPS